MIRTFALSIALVAVLAVPTDGIADPCGMVPPIQITGGTPPNLERIGPQRTWVMFSGGVETMALRPGFEGNVEDFGMLIPFPTPPAIRKIEDATFAHIEAAVDPPTLTVEVIEEIWESEMSAEDDGGAIVDAPTAEEPLAIDQVRVLREEAVGMYQVAVLEAGSPAALEAWMGDNGYQYPTGMDAVAQDYVNEKWCFVAVKARVGPESATSPAPGMREVDPSLPAGASFDGHVQGMGFRFATEQAVVPMRLSVFNGVDPRNVVYMLTDEPVRIDGVPLSTVVRQVDGHRLYANVTEPIPVTYIGDAGEKDLTDSERAQVAGRRDPAQYSGVARDLFAADLMALRSGELALAVEELDKELLNISEALGLRGEEIDALHADVLEQRRREETGEALKDLERMHLTVIDGIFPRQLLESTNLSFTKYAMGAAQNQPRTDPIRPAAGNLTFWR